MTEFSWKSNSTSTSKLHVLTHQVIPPTPCPKVTRFNSCPGRRAATRAPESQPTGPLALQLLFFHLWVAGPPWELLLTPRLGWAAAAKCRRCTEDAVLVQQSYCLYWLLSSCSIDYWEKHVSMTFCHLTNQPQTSWLKTRTYYSPRFCRSVGQLCLLRCQLVPLVQLQTSGSSACSGLTYVSGALALAVG